MEFCTPSSAHINELMNWFASADELRDWGGPDMRHPFTEQTFTEDIKLESLNSLVMLSAEQEMLAFGQCYERENRCHLGRLAIAPQHRGKGLIDALVGRLLINGTGRFEVSGGSLFVVPDNLGAIKAYQRYGFRFADYPGDAPIAGCLYMIIDDIETNHQ